MSLFDMQGMEAEDSKVRQDDGRSVLSVLSSALIGGDCRASSLSAIVVACQ